jgi:hypothetical protein
MKSLTWDVNSLKAREAFVADYLDEVQSDVAIWRSLVRGEFQTYPVAQVSASRRLLRARQTLLISASRCDMFMVRSADLRAEWRTPDL